MQCSLQSFYTICTICMACGNRCTYQFCRLLWDLFLFVHLYRCKWIGLDFNVEKVSCWNVSSSISLLVDRIDFSSRYHWRSHADLCDHKTRSDRFGWFYRLRCIWICACFSCIQITHNMFPTRKASMCFKQHYTTAVTQHTNAHKEWWTHFFFRISNALHLHTSRRTN